MTRLVIPEGTGFPPPLLKEQDSLPSSRVSQHFGMLKFLYFQFFSKQLVMNLDGGMRRTGMSVSSTGRPPARKLASRALTRNRVGMPAQPETAKEMPSQPETAT